MAGAIALASSPIPAFAEQPTASCETATGSAVHSGGEAIEVSAEQLFALADAARNRGDLDTAEAAYRALAENPDVSLRNEARYRLAMLMADQRRDYTGAAVLLRQILDEQPDAAPVRLQLARMQAMLGDLDAADRELRAAQAVGLPPDVERLVRFFRSGLANRSKPFGLNLEVALAPDTNINRATQSETLETVIGDFDLSDDAQAKSGLGIATRAAAYARLPVEAETDLMFRLNTSGRFYEESQFNDIIVGVQAGPQYRLGSDRLDVSGIASWRWFGGDAYTHSYGASGAYRHPLGKKALLRLDVALVYNDDQLNDLRDAERASVAVGIDKALSARTGGGLRIDAARSFANDPGYSTASGGISGYIYREFGSTTAVLRAGYDRIEADKRLLLYPERRVDNRVDASLAGTFRALRVGAFAPQLRLSYERSFSTIEIYDYSRAAAEIGIVAAF